MVPFKGLRGGDNVPVETSIAGGSGSYFYCCANVNDLVDLDQVGRKARRQQPLPMMVSTQ